MFYSLKNKLLLSFALFLVISLSVIGINFLFNIYKDKTLETEIILKEINFRQYKIKALERDFFIDETINPEFYKSGQSSYLQQRTKEIEVIKSLLFKLANENKGQLKEIENEINKMLGHFDEYLNIFERILRLTVRRGFKDFGLEGEMRTSIRQIENKAQNYGLNMTLILMVRRHEKDFFLRKEKQYVHELSKAVGQVMADISWKVLNQAKNKELKELLDKYQHTFIEICNAESEIGFNNQQGLRKELASLSSKIDHIIYQLNSKVENKLYHIRKNRDVLFVLLISILLCLLIFLAFYLTKFLSKPISKLSSSIHQVIQNNFEGDNQLEEIRSKDEIGSLSRDFAFMYQKVRESMEEIRKKSLTIEQKQNLLMKSIDYAKKIQNTILPEDEDFRNLFNEHLLIYLPLQVVSGDFYWLSETQKRIFLAVVDCTGHGIPGAFMSMVGYTLLNKILKEKKINDPATLLEELDKELREMLHQEQKKNDDGMDISVCMLEGIRENKPHIKVTFSGAKGKVFYTKNGEVRKIKGDSRTIGGSRRGFNHRHLFTNHIFNLNKGEKLYLSSDGYFDQPDKKRKKFGIKKFLKILEENHHIHLKEQEDLLLKELIKHSAVDSAQRDDITVLAVQL